jgi:hypothetical protein
MSFSPLGLIELFVVFGFAIGWGILELVCLRMDKKRERQREAAEGKEREG